MQLTQNFYDSQVAHDFCIHDKDMRYYKNSGISFENKGLPMQKCDCLTQYFSDYLEKQLDSSKNALIEQHLQDCPKCHQTLKQMQMIQKNLVQLKPIKTSADFDTVLHTRIRLASSLERRSWFQRDVDWTIKVPIYAASLSIILLASILITREINQPPRSNFSPISLMQADSQLANTKNSNTDHYEMDVYPLHKIAPQSVATPSTVPERTDKPDTTQDKQTPSTQLPPKMMIHTTNFTF